MKSSTQLESVVFRLTPTRTRCDLIIIANGKKEKIASGLLNPFLAHLKSAQDQIAKGGYSIILQPDSQSIMSWFTKGTVERFVRFVSTPDILERVYIIESEIIQIEETIAIQGKSDIQHGLVEDQQTNPSRSCYGNKSKAVVKDDKAVVLYKPEEHQPQTSGSSPQEGNPRTQILKILESRKSVLEKEQGMAFARAVAAGFHFDDMPLLLSFGECFGASRLRDACLRFMELWKKKHEVEQWVESGTAEAVAGQTGFSAMNPHDILFSNVSHSNTEKASDSNEKLSTECTAGERPPMDLHVPKGQQENLQGQFPPWSMYSPASALPLLQPYSAQGVPYCHPYSQNKPLYPPYAPPIEDPRVGIMQRTGPKRQSTDKKNSNTESFLDNSEWDYEDPHYQKQRKKAGWSRNGQSRKIIIQNINYISKTNSFISNNSESASDTQSIVDTEDLLDSNFHVQNEASRSSKAKGSNPNSYDEGKVNKAEIDGGHWLAFQNILFREANEDNCTEKDHMFAMEKCVRRQKDHIGDDHTNLGGQGADGLQDSRENDIHKVSIDMPCIPSRSNDEVLLCSRECGNILGHNDQIDFQYAEINGEKVFSKTANKLEKTPSQYMADESFIVPVRSILFNDAVSTNITTIDTDCELPTTTRNTENNSNEVRSQINYEPIDLGLMPKCETEKSSSRHNPTLDYEMILHVEDSASQEKGKKGASSIVKEVPKKLDKDQRAKADLDNDNTVGRPLRRGKLSKTSHIDDARARAERLRSFKADMEKMKKEKEEADIKRIEALKLERQKRIAARGSSNSAHLVATQSQKRRLPTKLSPTPGRGSKFSDSEPGSSSPLQRSKIRTLVSTISPMDSKSSKLSDGQLKNIRITKSAPSLSDPNKESSNSVTPDSKASMARLRRLSESKTVNRPIASVKAHSPSPGTVSKAKVFTSETMMKQRKSGGPEKRKISAIADLDMRKAATLPELKIRALKGLSEFLNDSRPPINSEDVKSFTNDEKVPRDSLGDENIVEKTVVVLEYESSSLPVAHALPPSPFVGFARDLSLGLHQGQLNSHEVGTSYADETPKFANIDHGGKPYEAPCAHITSLEEPCTGNSQHPKSNVEDASTKARVKEPPRGLWRLWKFGKKNQSPSASDKTLEPDRKSVNGQRQDGDAASTNSSSEVYTLKNLISQDETPTTDSAVQKSRHFSLFSSFWSRTSEKKLAS